MKIRLVREIDGEHTFWKVQRYSWLIGWHGVPYCDSVTCNEEKARNLFDRLQRGETSTIEVIQEGEM